MKKYMILVLVVLMIVPTNIVYGEKLGLSATSYIVMDAKSGRVLLEKNSHNPMPIASTTKIMTALLAIENGNLKDKVTINKESVGIEGSSIYLREDEILSLKDMVYGLMLRSGNDVAEAIAYYIGKEDRSNFISMMNNKAKAIGTLNTNFMNPHGLHDESHYSSAYDMALITREALKFDSFKEIVKTKLHVADRPENNYFSNKNKTLWQYSGGDGVKTGYTTIAGRCLVSSATVDGVQLIAVSLNSPDWFNDNYKLLNYGFDNFTNYLVYDKNKFASKIEVVNGLSKYVNLITETEFYYPLKEDEKENIKIYINLPDSIKAPIDKSQQIGTIDVYLDGKLINRGKLVSKTEIKEMNFMQKIINKMLEK